MHVSNPGGASIIYDTAYGKILEEYNFCKFLLTKQIAKIILTDFSPMHGTHIDNSNHLTSAFKLNNSIGLEVAVGEFKLGLQTATIFLAMLQQI